MLFQYQSQLSAPHLNLWKGFWFHQQNAPPSAAQTIQYRGNVWKPPNIFTFYMHTVWRGLFKPCCSLISLFYSLRRASLAVLRYGTEYCKLCSMWLLNVWWNRSIFLIVNFDEERKRLIVHSVLVFDSVYATWSLSNGYVYIKCVCILLPLSVCGTDQLLISPVQQLVDLQTYRCISFVGAIACFLVCEEFG